MRTTPRATPVLAAGALALTLGVGLAAGAPPEPTRATPQLVEAARKEGKIVWYTSVDLPLAERVARAFETRYPGIAVRVERSGAERIFQRIGQEYGSRIFAVDAVNSSDAAHLIAWKRDGWLMADVPEDVARHYPRDQVDPDGMFAPWRVTLSPIGYNTTLVKREEAPRSFKDLLDPKWSGKIVKAHPGYSGTILTATYQISRELGWGFFERLAQQKVMQVQSATEPSKKLSLGERAVAADGAEYNLIQLKEKGQPIEIVYPTEGTPLVVGPSAIMKQAPNPSAARLFNHFLFSLECQQLIVDEGGLRSYHSQVKERPGRTPLRSIKLMREDPVEVEKQVEEIKTQYTRYFKV